MSHGLIQLRKGFSIGLQAEGLISEGAYNRNEKNRFETSNSSVDRKFESLR